MVAKNMICVDDLTAQPDVSDVPSKKEDRDFGRFIRC